jgi:NADH oxidase (H2O-forming)
MKSLELKKDIYWIGSLDPDLRIFDIIMETKFGTTYNSYIVKGSEKTAIFETVKVKFFDEYLKKIEQYVDPRKIGFMSISWTQFFSFFTNIFSQIL